MTPVTKTFRREDLQFAVKKSRDLLDLCSSLGVPDSQSGHLEKKLRSEGFDLSHWEVLSDPEALRRFNEACSRGEVKERKRTLTYMIKFDQEILPTLFDSGVRNGGFVSRYLGSYNRYYQWLKYECYYCGSGPEWQGKSLTLQLHHKDGNSDENSLGNLCYACPNCHSQTENFCGRNTAFFRIV